MSSEKITDTNVEETSNEAEPNPLRMAARKVMLCYIGFFVLAKEEIEDLINRMVEQGEIAERDGRQMVREAMEKRQGDAREAASEAPRQARSLRNKVTLATKADVDALNERINQLSKEIEEYTKP